MKNSVTCTLNASVNVCKWDYVAFIWFSVAQEVQRRTQVEAGGHQQTGLKSTHVGKESGVWWSSVDFSNYRKSAKYEKGQWVEDYHQRFRHVGNLCKNGSKTAEWSAEGSPHAGVSGHHRMSSYWTRLAW